MTAGYTVKLIPRNGHVEYRDETGVYRFAAVWARRKWIVYLPGSKGERFERYELSDLERNVIFPRIARYLGGRRYFGFVHRAYPVIFERGAPSSTPNASSASGA